MGPFESLNLPTFPPSDIPNFRCFHPLIRLTISDMTREQILQRILDSGIVAVIRMNDPARCIRVIEAIREGGVEIAEITMTVPGALDLVRQTTRELGDDVPLGVGSVRDAETVHRAVEAGASYIVSPVFKPEVVEAAHSLGVPVMPGAFTPTEILAAHEAGADVVKVFPADVLGMAFFKGVLAPMPFLKLMPTGGVTLDNADQWLKAGAVAVGVGSALLDAKAIAEERYDILIENARRLRASFERGKER
jgi:2-dehydro-3-deoxyphosphogluconate aldolase / (4S)-4-hydroxy-2-oxoglutarate aldolase